MWCFILGGGGGDGEGGEEGGTCGCVAGVRDVKCVVVAGLHGVGEGNNKQVTQGYMKLNKSKEA